MRYNIPQFIDTEDRLIGSLTLKQFLWLLAGGGAAFIVWQFAGNITVFIMLVIPIGLISVLLAFWKINGKPLIMIAGYIFKFIKNPKTYIWRK